MKHKVKFIIGIVLYVLGWLYFGIFSEIAYGVKVSDIPLLDYMILRRNLPVGIRNLSSNIVVWIVISFFLVLYILWQTNLSGPALNRYGLIFEGLNLVLICLTRGIVDLIIGEDGFFTVMIVMCVLLVIVGIGLLAAYCALKKSGGLYEYEDYADIMTREEFNRWMEKKRKKQIKKQHKS